MVFKNILKKYAKKNKPVSDLETISYESHFQADFRPRSEHEQNIQDFTEDFADSKDYSTTKDDGPKYRLLKQKKRRIEILLAAFLLLIIGLVTWGQLDFFWADSWVFFLLVNVNAILMLIVLFLVARNVVHLLLERKRKIFGSRLKTRLVLAFFSITFIPILVMFLAANKIMTTSINYWFTGQVESSMQAALNVGQSFYSAVSKRLQVSTENFIKTLVNSPENSWTILITNHKNEYSLSLLSIMEKNINPQTGLETYSEKIWVTGENFQESWASIRHSINFQQIDDKKFESLLWAGPDGDYAVIALPIPTYPNLYIIGAERFSKGLLAQFNSISAGFEEYTELKNLKQPLKLSFSLVLGLLSLSVLFASVWLAFRISRELTMPIQALAEGTKQIAKGDWSFKVADKGQDELGQLVHSFNAMTNEMRDNQNRLQQMNWLIEDKNETLIQRNQYIEAILEHVTTGIVTLDEKGTLLTINKAACDIFKIQAERYEGLAVNMFLTQDYLALYQIMTDFIQNNPQKIWTHELEIFKEEQYAKLLIKGLSLSTFKGERKGADHAEHLANKQFYLSQNIVDDSEPLENSQNSSLESLLQGSQAPFNTSQDNAYGTGSIILVIEDITELSQEQRLVAWKEVAKRIAHEIKNPLTPIMLSAERLQRKFSTQVQDPVFTQCTGLILKEVSRMQSMVTDFSTFAALPDIHLVKENPIPILQELVSLFKISHSSIIWTLTEKSPLPVLMLDKKAFHRALFNIMSNAADAINAKVQKIISEQHIVLPMETQENTAPELEINSTNAKNIPHEATAHSPYTGAVTIICSTELNSSEEDPEKNLNEHVIIEIRDNGKGIAQDEVARLFEPYFSKKASGTGLGLAIVRSIIADHGGTVSAHNQSEGACIRITLPTMPFSNN